MFQSSKVTNVLLAIIALCLAVIAFKPASVFPPASAQAAVAETETERFTGITAATKDAQIQADATRAIATSIDGLAKSTERMAEAMDALARTVGDMASKSAESQAASPGGAVISVTPAK